MDPDSFLDNLRQLPETNIILYFTCCFATRFHKLNYYRYLLDILDVPDEVRFQIHENHGILVADMSGQCRDPQDPKFPRFLNPKHLVDTLENAIMRDDIESIQRHTAIDDFSYQHYNFRIETPAHPVPVGPLGYAAIWNSIRAFKFLLLNGCPIQLESELGHGGQPIYQNGGMVSTLYCAIASGNAEMVQVLLERGETITANSIIPAVYYCQNEILQWLFEQHDLTTPPHSPVQLVALAARNSNLNGVSLLMDHGADPCLQHSPSPITALDIAVEKKDVEMINLMLSKRSPLLPNDSLAVGLAAENGDLNIVSSLLAAGVRADGECLTAAARSSNVELLQFLVEHGVGVNEPAGNGDTPLIVAVESKQPECVMYLVENGANPKVRGANGYSALHAAAKCNQMEIAELLIENGAVLNAQDIYGNTPLHVAADLNNIEMIKLLLTYKAAKNVCNSMGMTPYNIALDLLYGKAACLLWYFPSEICQVF